MSNYTKTCDRCGVTVPGSSEAVKYINTGFFSAGNYCKKCIEEMEVKKKAEKQEKKEKELERKSDNSFSDGSSFSDLDGWGKFLVVMKWIFSYIWGGPYLIVQGYKTRNKFWFFTGIEFTIVLIIGAVIMNAIPGLTESTEPLHVFLTYLIGGLLLINVVALVVYWVKYREEY